jgi:hypothetical protein
MSIVHDPFRRAFPVPVWSPKVTLLRLLWQHGSRRFVGFMISLSPPMMDA